MKMLYVIFNDEYEMEVKNPLKAELMSENPDVFLVAYTTPEGVMRMHLVPLHAVRCITMTEEADAEVQDADR